MPYLLIYLAGVVVALAVMRDPWPARVGTAVVWPLGPLAFVLLVPVLLVSALILWPLRMLALAAVLAGVAWLLFA